TTVVVHASHLEGSAAGACPTTDEGCSIRVAEPVAHPTVTAQAPIAFGAPEPSSTTTSEPPTTTTTVSPADPTTRSTLDATTSTTDAPRSRLGGPKALAGPGPSITVTPNTGLADGQTVNIVGSGFPANDSLAAIQCAPPSVVSSCNVTGANFI